MLIRHIESFYRKMRKGDQTYIYMRGEKRRRCSIFGWWYVQEMSENCTFFILFIRRRKGIPHIMKGNFLTLLCVYEIMKCDFVHYIEKNANASVGKSMIVTVSSHINALTVFFFLLLLPFYFFLSNSFLFNNNHHCRVNIVSYKNYPTQ